MAIPPIREAVQWHISNNNDPAIRWLVEQLAIAATEPQVLDKKGNVVPIADRRGQTPHDELAKQFQSATVPVSRP
jgi:hypothetical protein